MSHQALTRLPSPSSQPCEAIENYFWELKLDQLGVVLNFVHRQPSKLGADPDHLYYNNQCMREAVGWRCLSRQE